MSHLSSIGPDSTRAPCDGACDQTCGGQRGAQQRIVDGLAEHAGRCEAAGVAEPGAVHRGAHDQLAHVASRGEPLELVHNGTCIRRGVGDRDAGEGVQAVGMHPDVGIGHSHRAQGRVAQARKRRRALPRRLVPEAPRPRGHGFPTRITDTAAERERVIKQPHRAVAVALTQRRLGSERLREGLERHPAVLPHQRERVVEHLGRLLPLAAEDAVRAR